jgi:hypothetical protein
MFPAGIFEYHLVYIFQKTKKGMVLQGKAEILRKGAVLRNGKVLAYDTWCFDRMPVRIDRIGPSPLDDLCPVAQMDFMSRTISKSTEELVLNSKPFLLIAPVETPLGNQLTVMGRIVKQAAEGVVECISHGKKYFFKPLAARQRAYFAPLVESLYGNIRYEIPPSEAAEMRKLSGVPDKEPVRFEPVINYGKKVLEYAMEIKHGGCVFHSNYYFIVGGDYEMALYAMNQAMALEQEGAGPIMAMAALRMIYRGKLPALVEIVEKIEGMRQVLDMYKEALKEPIQPLDTTFAVMIIPDTEEMYELKRPMECIEQRIFEILEISAGGYKIKTLLEDEIMDALSKEGMLPDYARALSGFWSHPNFIHAIYLKENIKQG